MRIETYRYEPSLHNKDGHVFHVCSKICDKRNAERFFLPFRETSLGYLANLTALGQDLVKGLGEIPGIIEISTGLYDVYVIKAAAFDWDRDVKPKVTSLFKLIFARHGINLVPHGEDTVAYSPEVPKIRVLHEVEDVLQLLKWAAERALAFAMEDAGYQGRMTDAHRAKREAIVAKGSEASVRERLFLSTIYDGHELLDEPMMMLQLVNDALADRAKLPPLIRSIKASICEQEDIEAETVARGFVSRNPDVTVCRNINLTILRMVVDVLEKHGMPESEAA